MRAAAALVLSLAFLTLALPASPAGADGPSTLIRVGHGYPATFDFPAHHAALVVARSEAGADGAVTVSRLVEWGTRHAGFVSLSGPDAGSLEGRIGAKADYSPYVFVYAGTPTARLATPTLPPPDVPSAHEHVAEGHRFTLAPGGELLVLVGLDTLDDAPSRLVLEADGVIEFEVRAVPFAFYEHPNWPSELFVSAGVPAPVTSAQTGVAMNMHVPMDVGHRLYAAFVNNADGALQDAVTGPGYSERGVNEYRIFGGAPGRWDFHANLTAGTRMDTFLLSVDVPDAR